MDSPLGPTLANIFSCYLEKILLQNCPSEFKPVIYRNYVGDTSLLFCLKHHIEKFRNYLNRQNKNIRFTSEIENENSILFLDIKINRGKFTISVDCKQTFSGVFTNFGSFILKSYKYNILFTLLHRAFKVCSNFELLHQEIDKLKTIFKDNGYPKSFFDLCIKKYLNKVFIKKDVVLKASKKELIYVLPFIGNKALGLKICLVNSIEKNLNFCKLKFIFESSCELSSLFRYIKIPLRKIFPLVLFTDTRVVTASLLIMVKDTATFFIRAGDHTGISNLNRKCLKSIKRSAVSDHLLECNCSIDFDHFDILASDANKFRLLIKESLFIKRD